MFQFERDKSFLPTLILRPINGLAAVSFVHITFLLPEYVRPHMCPLYTLQHITLCILPENELIKSLMCGFLKCRLLHLKPSRLHSTPTPPHFKPNSVATAANRQWFTDFAPSVNSKTLSAGNTTETHSQA